MNSYVWKHFPGSEDWGLFPRGTKEIEEDTAIVILSRQNKFFPWSIYVRGNRDKTLEANAPSDNLKDIKEYILGVVDKIDKNVGMNGSKEESLNEKIVRTVKDLDDDIYVEHDVNEDRYYLASDYDRYVWTNFKSIQDAEDFYKYHKNDVRNSILEEKLTEAPDDDGIMSDDELDAEEQRERDELEARLKARRDKVAQERSERDAKVAKENELKAKADEKAKEIGDDWSFDHLFDVLVPSSGKCDSLAGELLRAANRIDYRWFNDGDRFFEDYGIETCGQPAYFLMNFEINDETPLWDFLLKVAEDEADDKYYDSFLDELKNRVAEIIQDNPTLLVSETNDMYDVASVREVANFFYDHNMVPQYDFDCSIPPELDAHLERGNIDERDIVWYVQDIIANMGDSSSDVEVSWGSVYIHDLDRNDYDELNGNLYRWLEDYAQELTDEYGDPDAIEDEPEEEQEEADESLKEDQEQEKEPDDNENHGYATKENYERSQAILDEMSQLRKDEGEQESKFLKAWAVDKVISDDEFTKKMKKLHKEIQDKEDALYKELCELHTKDKELKNQEEK